MANKSSATTQNSKSTAKPEKQKPETKIKTFVIDTSVLLAVTPPRDRGPFT